MLYRLFADLVVVLHLAFVLFVVAGALAVLRWRWWAWLHVPAFLWGALISFFGWVCPLTPLENWLRARGGGVGYRSSFIEHYLLPVLYPEQLTRSLQIGLGAVVLGVNLAIYAWALVRWRRAAAGAP